MGYGPADWGCLAGGSS